MSVTRPPRLAHRGVPARAAWLGRLDRAGHAVAAAPHRDFHADLRAALAELVGHAREAVTASRGEVERLVRLSRGINCHGIRHEFYGTGDVPVTPKDVFDVGTAWVERGNDFEISGTYDVLADDSPLLGYLGRDRRPAGDCRSRPRRSPCRADRGVSAKTRWSARCSRRYPSRETARGYRVS